MKPALIALLALVAAVAAGCGSSGSKTDAVSRRHLLAAPQVQVIAYPNGDVRMCSGASDLMFGPPFCPSGPLAVGVRTDALRDRSSKPAERWGSLHLVGVYSGGTFHVVSQGRWQIAPNPPSPFEAPIPCPAPAGGWRLVAPTDAQRQALTAYQRTHRGELVSIAFFHDGTILVVASSHPARTRALLGPTWPRQLCVVRARYSRPYVNQVRAKVLSLMSPMSRAAQYGWVTSAGGYGVNDRGQTTISLQVLIETPQLRAFLRRLPRGLVAVDSTFKPVRAS